MCYTCKRTDILSRRHNGYGEWIRKRIAAASCQKNYDSASRAGAIATGISAKIATDSTKIMRLSGAATVQYLLQNNFSSGGHMHGAGQIRVDARSRAGQARGKDGHDPKITTERRHTKPTANLNLAQSLVHYQLWPSETGRGTLRTALGVHTTRGEKTRGSSP